MGVGAVVLNGEGHVLLVKRAHEPLKGEWSLPGGGVEIGETLEASIVRELFEETGLTVDVGPVVEVLDRIEYAPDGLRTTSSSSTTSVMQPTTISSAAPMPTMCGGSRSSSWPNTV